MWLTTAVAVVLTVLAIRMTRADPGTPETQPNEMPCVALGRGETRTFDLHDAPLGDVVRVVSCALQRNMLLQPSVLAGRTVTFLAPKPIDRRGLLAAWHAMLLQHQLTEERRGGFFVVRPVR